MAWVTAVANKNKQQQNSARYEGNKYHISQCTIRGNPSMIKRIEIMRVYLVPLHTVEVVTVEIVAAY